MSTVEKMSELHERRFEHLRSSPKPKIGWVSVFTPEEIIHAAGMIPFRITGESTADTSSATSLLSRNICSYVLSCLEEGMTGAYDFMDGFVTVDACNARKRLFDVWDRYLDHPFKHCMLLPRYASDPYREFFRAETARFARSIEEHFEREIGEDSLRRAIQESNGQRELLKALYAFRKRKVPGITGREAHVVMKAAMTGLRDEFAATMGPLLASLEDTPQDGPRRHRVLLCGSYFDHPNIIEAIEKTGALVVCEDNSSGAKYFEGNIDASGEPLQAIADYYFGKVTTACAYDTDARLARTRELIDEYDVDSVVYFSLKFCDPNLIDYPYVRQSLVEAGTPVLYVEAERHLTNMESIRTRIASFFETKIAFAGAAR